VIPTPPRLVLFDLDGTLLDTIGDITAALQIALEGTARPVLDRASVAKMVGDGARVLVTRALGMEPSGPPAEEAGTERIDSTLARFLAAYEDDPTPSTRFMPGAIELLDALQRSNVRIALCTNKPRAITVPIVERMLAGRIDTIVAGGDTPRLKPDRGPIDRALSILRLAPSVSVMVGDAPQDIRAAHAAGVAAVGVRGGYGGSERLEDASPDLLVDRLDALIRVFGLPQSP